MGTPLQTCSGPDDVVRHPVVGIEECLHMPACALDRFHMCPSTHINETDRMVDGLVCVAVRFQVPVRTPAVT
jgi:hypothetical protein